MRIGVLFSAENNDLGRKTVATLVESGFRVRSFVIRTVPRLEPGRADTLSAALESCDLPVYVFSGTEFLSRIFVFSAGFFFGRGRSGIVFTTREGVFRSAYFKSCTRVQDLEELVGLLERERLNWTRRQEVRAARRSLLRHGLCLNDESFASCVADGDEASARSFLKAGFSTNARDRKGVPLLSLAVRNRHRAIVNLLLENGAEINAISSDRENTALMDASACGDLEILSDLISHGADLNVRSRNGQTALVLAIGNGETQTARILVEAGADAQIPDKLGMTALKYAELFRHEEILRILRRGV